jgi:hypothetical protein
MALLLALCGLAPRIWGLLLRRPNQKLRSITIPAGTTLASTS